MSMKEQLVKMDTAVLAESKGFNEYCVDGYIKSSGKLTNIRQIDFEECAVLAYEHSDEEKLLSELFLRNSDIIENYSVAAPTQSELQTWLRKEHNIRCYVYEELIFPGDLNERIKVVGDIWHQGKKTKYNISFPTNEERWEEILVEALNLIK